MYYSGAVGLNSYRTILIAHFTPRLPDLAIASEFQSVRNAIRSVTRDNYELVTATRLSYDYQVLRRDLQLGPFLQEYPVQTEVHGVKRALDYVSKKPGR